MFSEMWNEYVVLYNDTYDIGLTGNALDSDISYFLSCGADEVMAKPFDSSIFQEKMKKYNGDQVGT